MKPMDAQWLNKQFKINPKKSKAKLATALGLEPPSVSKILNGTRQIKAQEYLIMRDYFDLPNDAENSNHSATSYTLQPLMGPKGLGAQIQPKENWVIPASLLSPRTDAAQSEIKVFKIQESMMAPDFNNGEHVIIDLSDHTPSPPGIFAVSDGFGMMIRHCEFMAGSKPPAIRVSANQQKFQPQILRLGEFKVLGRVIAKLQWT